MLLEKDNTLTPLKTRLSPDMMEVAHPHMFIGLFTKMVNKKDQNIINLTLATALSSADGFTKSEKIKAFLEYLTFNQALNYLSFIDLNNKTHTDYLKSFDATSFLKASNQALEYFSEEEQYEKCVFIKKIQDFIKG